MILVIGIAGSGKSTQCQLLEATGRFSWLSVGQLLRTKITDPKQIAVIEKGDILADQIVLPMVSSFIRNREDVETTELILDGFPRTLAQCQWLLTQSDAMKFTISGVIHLNVSEDLTRQRLLKRGRTDDYSTAIAERFREYETMILPILSCLKSNGVKVIEVNGVGEPELVHKAILKGLNS